MKELIGTAILIATLFGGTIAAEKIFSVVRKEALIKAASGLPKLSPLSYSLTRKDIAVAERKSRPRKNRNPHSHM